MGFLKKAIALSAVRESYSKLGPLSSVEFSVNTGAHKSCSLIQPFIRSKY